MKPARSLTLLVILAVLFLVILDCLYFVAGKGIVRNMYEGSSIPILNNLITGQSQHTLQHYIEFVRQTIISIHLGMTCIIVGLFILTRISLENSVVLLIGLALALLTYETTVFSLIRNPKHLNSLPEIIWSHVNHIYRLRDRKYIQSSEDCAVYDELLAYTLKPGACTFSNREFSNLFTINQLGVRDDAASLKDPVVVVIGDSLAMGWGVDQEKTYAQLIESWTGKKVLNTGISSYGTVREFRMLERVDTTNLEYLIIHYHENDLPENLEFMETKELSISSKDRRDEIMRAHLRRSNYVFGKYFTFTLESLFGNLFAQSSQFIDAFLFGSDGLSFRQEQSENKTSVNQEVKAFIYALENVPSVPLTDVKIVLIETSGPHRNRTRNFVERISTVFNSRATLREYNVIGLDLRDQLDRSNFYTLDTHLNEDGHRVVAEHLRDIIN